MAKDTKFNLTIEINGKQVANTLQGVGSELGKLNRDIKKLTPGTDEFVKKSAELHKARDQYKSLKDEVNNTNNVLEEARGNWDNVISGFLSGNLSQASEGLKGIAGNIKGITKAAISFIATPLGAALTAVTGIGLGVKAWVGYNLEIEKTNQLVRDLTQESGDAVDLIRIRAEELSNTFDVDVKESIESAKSLAKGFGISYEEAFDIIEDGAIRGKLTSGEFLDSLKEYPVQFKNAGFSATEFADIVNAGIDLSIYSDKLPDAIKEFNLAITEQTPAAREALENAFGPEFTGKLLDGLRDGSITAKDALAQISGEAERIGLNSQQAQLLTADLFKGAGEDAGGALNIFKAVNQALNDQKKPLTDIQLLQKQQLEANKELNLVQTQLFASGSKGFNMWIQKGKLFATETIIKILKGGVDLYNWFVDLNNESQVFSGILTLIGKASTLSFSIVSEGLQLLWSEIKAVGTVFEGIFTLDPAKIKEGLDQAVDGIGESFGRLKEKAIGDATDIFNAFSGNDKAERFSLDDFIAEDTTTNTTAGGANNSGGVSGAPAGGGSSVVDSDGLTAKDKAILESKKRLKQLLAENEMEEENQRLEQEILDAETEEEKVELEFERLRWIAEQELEIQRNKELEELRLKGATQEEIAAVEEKFRLQKKAADNKITAEKKKADEKLKKEQKKADEDELQRKELLTRQQVAVYSQMFGNIAQLLGEHTAAGKAAGIAQATINTYQGVTEVWKAPAVLPEPMNTASKGIATATTLASGLATVNKIAGVPVKFYNGGNTGDQILFDDEYGGVTGVVHKNEWVAPEFMTKDPTYAPTLKWLEKERKQKLGQFYEGGPTSSTSSSNSTSAAAQPPASDTSMVTMQLLESVNRLNSHFDNGIKAYVVRDYESFMQQKEIDTEHESILNNTRK
jgi:hypothetical protein